MLINILKKFFKCTLNKRQMEAAILVLVLRSRGYIAHIYQPLKTLTFLHESVKRFHAKLILIKSNMK